MWAAVARQHSATVGGPQDQPAHLPRRGSKLNSSLYPVVLTAELHHNQLRRGAENVDFFTSLPAMQSPTPGHGSEHPALSPLQYSQATPQSSPSQGQGQGLHTLLSQAPRELASLGPLPGTLDMLLSLQSSRLQEPHSKLIICPFTPALPMPAHRAPASRALPLKATAPARASPSAPAVSTQVPPPRGSHLSRCTHARPRTCALPGTLSSAKAVQGCGQGRVEEPCRAHMEGCLSRRSRSCAVQT